MQFVRICRRVRCTMREFRFRWGFGPPTAEKEIRICWNRAKNDCVEEEEEEEKQEEKQEEEGFRVSFLGS